MHGVELLQCLGLSRVAHPGTIGAHHRLLLQTVLEGLLQVLHQTIDALFAGLREIVLDIELADGLAQTFADGGDNMALVQGNPSSSTDEI